jgi:hypothetical protein
MQAKSELLHMLSFRIVEIIHLSDVDDIQRSNQENCVVLRRSRRGPSVTFESAACEALFKVI